MLDVPAAFRTAGSARPFGSVSKKPSGYAMGELLLKDVFMPRLGLAFSITLRHNARPARWLALP
jgi:hypothetical protein